MKILIIVKSKHQENTLKIAEAMSEAAPATVVQLDDAHLYNLKEYDIIGLGSGIYYGKHDKGLIAFVKKNIDNINSAFVFSTSGTGKEKYNGKLCRILEENGKKVLGSFTCKGLDKFFIFAIGGGVSKGHPSIEDFDAAQSFIENIVKDYGN